MTIDSNWKFYSNNYIVLVINLFYFILFSGHHTDCGAVLGLGWYAEQQCRRLLWLSTFWIICGMHDRGLVIACNLSASVPFSGTAITTLTSLKSYGNGADLHLSLNLWQWISSGDMRLWCLLTELVLNFQARLEADLDESRAELALPFAVAACSLCTGLTGADLHLVAVFSLTKHSGATDVTLSGTLVKEKHFLCCLFEER